MNTYIILVNYNNWHDTIICIQDLIQKRWEDVKLIIVDNKSSDDSISKLRSYLKGDLNAYVNKNFPVWQPRTSTKIQSCDIDINLIESNQNKGFAYGNNLGIKKAFEIEDGEEFHIWLLNNDTVLDPDSLTELIKYYESDQFGLIGSKIIDFDPPHALQSLYGSFNKYNAVIKVKNEFGDKISYPIGASMFTNSKIIEEVGFLDEDYFLYYEELDFSTKIRRAGYKIGIADKSIVYHHQGASTNSKKGLKKQNLKIESFKYDGLKKYYKKNYPHLLPVVYLNLFAKGVKLGVKGHLKNSLVIFKSIFLK